MGGTWQQPSASRNSKTITFEGGHNVGAPSVSIHDNQSTVESGWGIDSQFPSLHTRLGRSAYGASGAATPRLLTSFQNSTLLRAVGTKVQKYASGWSDLATGLTDTDWTATNFEVAGNPAIILTNGTDPVKYWDGTTFGNLNANAPKGKHIATDKIRTFIAKGDVLNYSAFLDAQDWTTPKNAGSVQAFTPKGGDITALASYSDRIVVFKYDAMSELNGTNYFEFRLMDVSTDIGCVNAKTVQEVQGLLLWLGPGFDVYVYTGARPKPIGDAIRSYLNSINTTYLDRCFAGTDGLRYYLGLVTGTNTQPDTFLVFDPKLNIWHVFSTGQSYRLSYLLNGLWFISDSSGLTYQMTGTTDDGTAITSTYVTKAFDWGVPQAEKEYYEAHIQGYLPVASTLSFYVSGTERGDDFQLIETIEGAADSQSADIIIPLDTIPLCKWARFKLVTTGEASLYQMEVLFDVLPIQI